MEEENLREYTQEVKNIFEAVSSKYTEGFTASDAVPISMRSDFYAYMENYNDSMAMNLARLMTRALLEQADKEEILETLAEQTKRLPKIVSDNDEKFTSYLELKDMADYPYYLLVMELDGKTCELCQSRGGRVYTIREIENLDLIPPLHPNCRCSLVAMDNTMFSRYTRNIDGYRKLFTNQLYVDGDGLGGVYYLAHEATGQGVSSDTLLPVKRRESAISHGGDSQSPKAESLFQNELSSSEYLRGKVSEHELNFIDWAKTFGEDAASFLEGMDAQGWALFDKVKNAESLTWGVLYAIDLLSGGTIGSTIAQAEELERQFKETPSGEAFLNWLTLGLLDTVERIDSSEAPCSFENFLDVLSVLGFAFSARSLGSRLRTRNNVTPILPSNVESVEVPIYQPLYEKYDELLRSTTDDLGLVTSVETAEAVNFFLKNSYGLEDPCLWRTEVYTIALKEDTRFVRIYGDGSGMTGFWVFQEKDIFNFSKEEIRSYYALPKENAMTEICDVVVPAGTVMDVSIANGIMGGYGGAVQFRFVSQYMDDWFVDGKPY